MATWPSCCGGQGHCNNLGSLLYGTDTFEKFLVTEGSIHTC